VDELDDIGDIHRLQHRPPIVPVVPGRSHLEAKLCIRRPTRPDTTSGEKRLSRMMRATIATNAGGGVNSMPADSRALSDVDV
jgi:hypothetical protein